MTQLQLTAVKSSTPLTTPLKAREEMLTRATKLINRLHSEKQVMKLVPSSFSRSLDSRSQDPFAVKAIGCADPKGSVSEWRRSQVCRTSIGSPFSAVSIPISSTKGSNLKILDSDFLKIRQIETSWGGSRGRAGGRKSGRPPLRSQGFGGGFGAGRLEALDPA